MKSNFLNARELHLYRSSGHELGTIRKLRFSAFQRHQNYARRRRIIAFRDVVEISKIHQKNQKIMFLKNFHLLEQILNTCILYLRIVIEYMKIV